MGIACRTEHWKCFLTSGAGVMLSSTLETWSGVVAQTQCDYYVHSLKLPLFGLSVFPLALTQSIQEESAVALFRVGKGL